MDLKMELLDFVISFCFHSSYNHVLLSTIEMDELKQIYVAFVSPNLPNNPTAVTSPSSSSSASTSSRVAIANLPYCIDDYGLISRIIRVLKTEPNSSMFK